MKQTKPLQNAAPTLIWLVGVAFVLFQFFLQLSSGVVIDSIMHHMHLSAFTAGMLSSALYIVYTILQIPVGSLFDRKSARWLMTLTVLLCSFGCFLFAISYTLLGLFLGRILIGAGSAFAFIGLAHLLRTHFPLKQFAFMIGLSETLGFFVSMIGMVSLGVMIAHWGWRGFILSASLCGVLIGYFSWRYIPENNTPDIPHQEHKQHLLSILKNKKAWMNGFFVGLSFSIVTVFGALWSVPFIQVKLTCSIQEASFITALFFFGTGLSCPLFGILSAKLNKRKPLMISSCLSTAFWLFLVIYTPIQSVVWLALLMFLMGLSCGSYMLAYSIANELAPAGALSTSTGFTNTLALITTPLLQPFVGYVLDVCSKTKLYSLHDFKIALLVLPCSLLAAGILVCFLPEKQQR